MRLPQESFEIPHRAVGGVEVRVTGSVVPVILQRRLAEREKPERRYPQVLQIVQFLGKPRKISDSVPVAVGKGLHVQFVEDGVFIPKGIIFQGQNLFRGRRAFFHNRSMPQFSTLDPKSFSDSHEVVEIPFRPHPAPDAENVRRGDSGVHGHVIPRPGP